MSREIEIEREREKGGGGGETGVFVGREGEWRTEAVQGGDKRVWSMRFDNFRLSQNDLILSLISFIFHKLSTTSNAPSLVS